MISLVHAGSILHQRVTLTHLHICEAQNNISMSIDNLSSFGNINNMAIIIKLANKVQFSLSFYVMTLSMRRLAILSAETFAL